MKRITIIAKDKNDVELGRREVDEPETFAELLDEFEEKDILKYAVAAWKIDVQRELRAPAHSKADPLVRAFKALTVEQRIAALEKANEMLRAQAAQKS